MDDLSPMVDFNNNQSSFEDHFILMPSSFDARIRWPHCNSIGDIKNQGSCKSGWVIIKLI